MRNLVLFLHVSADGYVAGPNGSMDWIHVDDEIFDYAGDQTDNADTAVYGRITYEMMEGYWPAAGSQPGASKHDIQHSRWYNSVTKVIFSRTMPAQTDPLKKIVNEHFAADIKKIKEQPGKNLLMFGSPSVAEQLIAEGFVDEIWLFVNPVLIGAGKSFTGKMKQQQLELVSSKSFSSGIVCLQYRKKQQ